MQDISIHNASIVSSTPKTQLQLKKLKSNKTLFEFEYVRYPTMLTAACM